MSLSIEKVKFQCLECGKKSKYLFDCLCQCCKNCFKINIYKSIKNPNLKKICFLCKKNFEKNSVVELKDLNFYQKILIFTKLKIKNDFEEEKKILIENIVKIHKDYEEATEINKKQNFFLNEKQIYLEEVLESILLKKKFLLKEIPTKLLLKDKFGILKKINIKKDLVIKNTETDSSSEEIKDLQKDIFSEEEKKKKEKKKKI